MSSKVGKDGKVSKTYRKVRGHATRHYYRVMPNKKHHRVLVWAVILSYWAIVCFQLLYPLDRALPLAMVGDQFVGWQTHSEIAAVTQKKFESTKVRFETGVKTSTYSLASAGAEIDTEGVIAQTMEYPFWWRYVPLSIFWQPVQAEEYGLSYSNVVLKEFGNKRAKELASAPVNARLDIKDGSVIADNDRYGIDISAGDIERRLRQLHVVLGQVNTIHPDVKSVAPERSATDFDDVRMRAEAILAHEFVIAAGGKEFIPSVKERASWLRIGSDEKDMPALTLDEATLGKYLDGLDDVVGKPAGQTHVTITNGNETARVAGESGVAVARDALITALKESIKTGQAPTRQNLELQAVAPVVIYNNKYTASQEGLQAYLNDMAQKMNVHIAVQEIDGPKWSASVGADDSMPSASTYKLFVAKWLFTEMEAGRIGWNDPILDTTVTTCFDRMTIASTNPCAQDWLRQVGRDNMNNFVYNLGFSLGTSFTNPVATHTTVNDLKKFMIGLNDSSLVGGAYRDRLLHSLSVHPYRYGIPTGSAGRVEDKVGFLWDYVHDAAIVHHPRGTYVLVIMTKGQSYARIAELTREIERILYP